MPLLAAAKLVAILVAGSLPFCAMGLAHRLFCRSEFIGRDHQSDLSAAIVLLRALGSDHVFAKDVAAYRPLSAALSSGPTRARSRGSGTT